MEHIVQFAIGIDDEAIRKRIEQTAEMQIVDGRMAEKYPWEEGEKE